MNIRRLPKRIIKGQKGQILIIALILLAVGSIVLGVLLASVRSGLAQGTVIEKRTSQLYLADGGVTQCVFWINNPSVITVATLPAVVNSYSSLPLTTSNNIKYKSYVTYLGLVNNNKTYQITSYAGPNIQNNANPATSQTSPYTKIVAQVSVTAATPGLFDNAITALNGPLTLIDDTVTSTDGNAANEGDIVAKGNISVTNHSNVYGDATVSSGYTITPDGTSTIYGSSSTVSSFNFPSIDTSSSSSIYQQATAGQSAQSGTPMSSFTSGQQVNNANTDYTTGLTLNTNQSLTFNGNLYVNGSISVGSSSSTLTVKGNLYVNGSVTVNSNSSLIVNGALYTASGLTVASSANLSLGGTTYVNGVLTLNNGIAMSAPLTIVANGDIAINAPITASIANTPVLISQNGNINLNSNSATVDAYLYDPNGTVNFTSSINLTGSVVGKSIYANSNVNITWIASGRSGLPGGGSSGALSVQTWNTTNS